MMTAQRSGNAPRWPPVPTSSPSSITGATAAPVSRLSDSSVLPVTHTPSHHAEVPLMGLTLWLPLLLLAAMTLPLLAQGDIIKASPRAGELRRVWMNRGGLHGGIGRGFGSVGD